MAYIFTVAAGLKAGVSISVYEGKALQIGRSARADQVFGEDRFMSGVHMQIMCSGEECFVRDLNSSNGTYVNAIRIKEARVHDGDQVRAGETVFLVAQRVESSEQSQLPPETLRYGAA